VTMFFARAALPMWVIALGLGLGAYFAPAGTARTVLLIALCLACIPAVISAGVRKRTLREPTAEMMNVWHTARQREEVIDAEFEVLDVTPTADADSERKRA